jgi:hypothetical protein
MDTSKWFKPWADPQGIDAATGSTARTLLLVDEQSAIASFTTISDNGV